MARFHQKTIEPGRAIYYNRAPALAGQQKFKYIYTYGLNGWLLKADYDYESGGAWQAADNFDVGSLGYSDEGNILTLQRRK